MRESAPITLSVMDGGVHVRLEQQEKPGEVPPAWQETAPAKTAPSSAAEATETQTATVAPTGQAPPAEDTGRVAIMFILDASGSMWGQVEGTAKIAIAKEVMTELIRDFPDDAEAGLVAYGHRRKGDCNDVEELKEAGIRFNMHVMGFDVTEEERLQLECMARAGGGEYFTAKTAQEFRAAAKRAVEKTQSFGHLRVIALRNGKPFNAYVEVYPQGGEEALKIGRTGTDAGRPGAKLEPGVSKTSRWRIPTPRTRPRCASRGFQSALSHFIHVTLGRRAQIFSVKNDQEK